MNKLFNLLSLLRDFFVLSLKYSFATTSLFVEIKIPDEGLIFNEAVAVKVACLSTYTHNQSNFL